MKIAIPTRDDHVDDHFGHCEYFTLITVGEDNKVSKRELMPSPQGCGCKSNLVSVLHKLGVTYMLAGSMGNGALNILENHGIRVTRGCHGTVHSVVESFLDGRLVSQEVSCMYQSGDHTCHNH